MRMINKKIQGLFKFDKQENFESLIDLFTLLSFSMIFIAIFWGMISSGNFEGSTFSFDQISPDYPNTNMQFPENLVMLFQTESEDMDEDIVYLMSEDGHSEIIYSESMEPDIEYILSLYSEKINKSNNFQFIIDCTVDYNPKLSIKIQQWLVKNSQSDNKKIRISFYGKQ